ncbi:DUF2652 domain-containing protein [Roseivirga misakiensis]|uniref:DUF2652 domain-containing protein n=1 Tax=Roseivirga misakiensis TaxID=1563681 RepID=A0A1E5T4S5_9BACT|nr:DUF2652 domain-containing protein [Roseivirga misakiensis]OEK06369.1 hypothetical protein BFP71_01450 [Roseivirga misakiensis]
MKYATILIPDISGYTKFLHKTELSHSTHIINELLQVVADTLQPKFTLAEIEGDALLTYADGKLTQAEIEEVCTNAFKNFNYFLNIVERDSVCRCGACNNASSLKLKFIVHYGQFEEVKISQFTKLSGLDMIIAHRLMKNTIPSKEYILVTDSFGLNSDTSSFEWQSAKDNYEVLGDVTYQYALIDDLKKEVLKPETTEDYSNLFGLARVMEVEINAPIKRVHEVLTDNSQKANFVEGLIDVRADSEINRVGSTHVCEFEGDSFDIKTLQNIDEKDQLVYIEKAHSINTGITMLTYFELKKVSENTTVISFRALTGDRNIIPEPHADMVYDQTKHTLLSLKNYLEEKKVA